MQSSSFGGGCGIRCRGSTSMDSPPTSRLILM